MQNMRFYLINTLVLVLISFGGLSQNSMSHESWTALLQKYVDPYGKVNYKGFKEDEKALDVYLELLKENHPGPYWKNEDQIAFWINAYNAFTIKLVLENYPVKSIMDIKKGDKDAWHISFIRLGDKMYTLDYIEKTMLLGQFNDSRIHFVINCSAKSCPPLRNKAFTGESMEIELRLSARRFINDNRFNILDKNHLQLSQIFNWYKDDFLKEEASVQEYIDKQTPHIEVSKTASITYLNYNWGLNE